MVNQSFGSQVASGHHIFDLADNEGTDIFILRDLEGAEIDLDSNRSSNFKIESVVGNKYLGMKAMTTKAAEIYDWLLDQTRQAITLTELEKEPVLQDSLGVFDPCTGEKFNFKNEEI